MQASANGARSLPQPQLQHDDIRHLTAARSGRLVYAKPQDLPSFPSIGLDAKGSAAGAAASLGWAKQKSPEPWRPETSSHALTAATMADDGKTTAQATRRPVASSHGAKAALLAAQSSKAHGVPKPPPSDDGLSAATLAFKAHRIPSQNTASAAPGRQKSLVAAKGAVARRQRSDSAPTIARDSYPDEANAAANALNAATRATRSTLSHTPAPEAGAVPYTTMNKLMFTSRPPVKPEVDEQQRADMLHASAVAMAKKMYTTQQKMMETRALHADTSASGNAEASSSVSDDSQPVHLTTLQDAAYKQAQARLARMQQDIEQNRGVQDHYGAKTLSRRFSVKEKLRKRALSDGAVLEDQKRSQAIKQQMSVFSNRLSEVDEQKRQQDQDLLLAAAQRNVHERLKVMDAKIANETGMTQPPTLTQWELKARALAHSRMLQQGATQQQGKVDIGAGMRMDQDDINAIAARRIQPILDEINAKAELEHARQTELRLEMERKKEQQEVEKARQKEVQDIQKKLKQQEKHELKERKAEEKQEAKARRDEEKAAKAEQKKLARVAKSRSAEYDHRVSREPESQQESIVRNSSGQPVRVPLGAQETEAKTSPRTSEESPTSPGGIKVWLKSRFSRGPKSPVESQSKGKANEKRFIGGASLTGSRDGNQSSHASLHSRSASAHELGLAGRVSSLHQTRQSGNAEVSDLSSDSEDEVFRREMKDLPPTILTPPRPIRDSARAQSRSPVRDSRFREII